MFQLSKRSRARLEGVHPDLVEVVEFAIQISDIDFMVVEGVRTVARQREYVAAGASKTMRSRHIPASNACGLGCAVDLMPLIGGKVSQKWPPYYPMAAAMKESAKALGTAIEWGGDWTTFRDGPHFELARSKYPFA